MPITNNTPEENVQGLFNRIAGNYDDMNNLITLHTHRHWRNVTMKKMALKPGDFAIDLCCGTGDWTIALAKAVGPAGHVVGLDFSEEMLAIAKKKVEAVHFEDRITLVQGDAMHLPYLTTPLTQRQLGLGCAMCPMPVKCSAKWLG